MSADKNGAWNNGQGDLWGHFFQLSNDQQGDRQGASGEKFDQLFVPVNEHLHKGHGLALLKFGSFNIEKK